MLSMHGPRLSVGRTGMQHCNSLQAQSQLARVASGFCEPRSRPRHMARAQGQWPNNASFDSSDELDKDLADELTAVADPNKFERMKQHLDLLWKVTKGKGPAQVCNCCRGSGEKECDWCHGTGFMTIGDQVFRSKDASYCPVCKAKGYVKCEFCKGTGSIAHWLRPAAEGPGGQQGSSS